MMTMVTAESASIKGHAPTTPYQYEEDTTSTVYSSIYASKFLGGQSIVSVRMCGASDDECVQANANKCSRQIYKIFCLRLEGDSAWPFHGLIHRHFQGK